MATKIRLEGIPGMGGVHSALQPPKITSLSARTAPLTLQFAQNGALKVVVGGHSHCLAKFMAPPRHETVRMKNPRASLGEFEVLGEAAEEEEVKRFFGNGAESGDVPLDDSVFEESFKSVRQVKKVPGARVRGVPIPRSTLVPDDWKSVQEYRERGKKERKLERREAELEWARRLAAQRREGRPVATRWRAREIISPDGDSAAHESGEKPLEKDSAALHARDTALDRVSDVTEFGEAAFDGDSADPQFGETTLDGESAALKFDETTTEKDLAVALALGEDSLVRDSGVVKLGKIPLDGDSSALHLRESSLDGGGYEFGERGTAVNGGLAALQLDYDMRVEGQEEDDSDWGESEIEEDGEREAASSGRAKPKNVRADLEFSSFEDIAQSLKENDLESQRSDGGQDGARGESEKNTEAPKRVTVTLTPEEKALLKAKSLDFARISSKCWSPLQTFAASGQVFLAAELLRKGGVDVDAVDGDGLTALQRAVQAGRKTMVRMLIKAGAKCGVIDKSGATLLHYSARLGNDDICKLLVRNGVDINVADADGWTALHVAVQSGRVELVKALVYRGADLTLKTNDGCTALDLALAFGGCFNFFDTIKFIKKRMVFDVESRPHTQAVDHYM